MGIQCTSKIFPYNKIILDAPINKIVLDVLINKIVLDVINKTVLDLLIWKFAMISV